MGEPVAIAGRWSGHIAIAVPPRGPDLLAITDDAGYDALVARLPAHRVQQRQPAPPSTDPLRARPAIDFARDQLIVAIRTDTMDPPLIAAIERAPGALMVRLVAPPPPPAARRLDIGGYAAVRVPRSELPLVARGPQVVTDPADLPAAVGELVTLRGPLRRTRRPTLLGVDVEADHAADGAAAEATGWLEVEDVTAAELEELIATRGQVAHRGPGRFYRLVAPLGDGLAACRDVIR